MTTPVPPRAVVVDDERALAQVVGGYLAREGFEVRLVHDGAEAEQVVRETDPDVVVLDLGLPHVDGVEVCRRIRTFSDCYVLMLTARSDEVDTLVGLSVGADDYLTKPFSPRELVARVRTLLRRPRRSPVLSPGDRGPGTGPGAGPLVVGRLEVDVEAREVRVDGRPVPLTRTELDVLAALAARPGQVLTRAAVIRAVWGDGWVGDEHLVDVHVLHLRQKLGDSAERQEFVRTVRGVGYRIGAG